MKASDFNKLMLSVQQAGKIKRGKAGHRHILTSKDRKRKNRLQTADLVDKSDHAKVKRLLPYA